jgi:oxalate decarboxylase/phosphoglucose isomerase-like protein (cupin superfamily)
MCEDSSILNHIREPWYNALQKLPTSVERHSGEILFGLVEENGGRAVSATVKPGQTMTIPVGLVHFMQNLGCKDAKLFYTFDHRDAGIQTTMSSFFKLPPSVIRQTLGVNEGTIEKLRKGVEANPDLSTDPKCMKRCGL